MDLLRGLVAECRVETLPVVADSMYLATPARVPSVSIVDEVEPRIRELLAAYPTMPATVIAERIGWERSIRTLSGRVAQLRPVYLPPDPASRTSYVAGEIGQDDENVSDPDAPVRGNNHIAARAKRMAPIMAAPT